MAFVKAERISAFNDAGFAHGGNVHDALAVFFNELNEVGQLSCGDGCLRSQAAGNGGRAPEKAMAAAAITAAGLSVLVNIFFYYSGIECRARESIQGLCDALCRHSYVKLRQTIKEKGVDECGELWPSG